MNNLFTNPYQNGKSTSRMVKNKRDLKSPRRRSVLTRPGVRKPAGPSTSANIKVVVRVRPPNDREKGDNNRNVVKVINDQLLVFDPEEDIQPFFYHGVQQKGRDLLKKAHKNMQFLFDQVFGFDAENADVFAKSTEHLISSLMEGCNCSVFVYGATGAGKTHTMLGHSENPGITFLTMKSLFDRKEALSVERDFELGVTYLEVYNEVVQDLLNPGATLHLREDGKYGVVVAGIQVKRIESSEELFGLLEQGNRNRTQHPTDANAESSRSHAVFQVYLKMTNKSTGQISVAKLSMIDLAGSERGAATGCAGQRFTEGSNINKSLLALGNCINSLADGRTHVPYRDSKLTRLLKDSLGGNCQTVMIANVSPSSFTYEDTYNTLKYAMRAKKIKTNVRKNLVNKEINVEQFVKINDELKMENERLANKLKELEGAAAQRDCQCKMNYESRNRLLELCSERYKMQERIHALEIEEHLLQLRKKVKEDADSRLSDLCTNTPDKEKGRKRLGSTVCRIAVQANALNTEIEVIGKKLVEIGQRIDEMGATEPELLSSIEVENAKLLQLQAQHKAEQQVKINERVNEDYKSLSAFVGKMSVLLRSCCRQLKGHNVVSDSMERDYKSLVQDMQGIHRVTWHEHLADQPLDLLPHEEESRKRKINEVGGSACSLDSTFTMGNSPRPPLTVCAKQLLSKESSKPPKKVAKISPRKENHRPIVRKPTAAMGTASRFLSAPPERMHGLTHRVKK